MIKNSKNSVKFFTFGSVLRIGAPKIHFCKMLNRLLGLSHSHRKSKRSGGQVDFLLPNAGVADFHEDSAVVFTAEISSPIAV
jgi:hypothetical protein